MTFEDLNHHQEWHFVILKRSVWAEFFDGFFLGAVGTAYVLLCFAPFFN